MTEHDVIQKILSTFSTVYKVTHTKVIKTSYGFDCTFRLNGDTERGIYYKGWFKWQSNGNIKLRLNKSL